MRCLDAADRHAAARRVKLAALRDALLPELLAGALRVPTHDAVEEAAA